MLGSVRFTDMGSLDFAFNLPTEGISLSSWLSERDYSRFLSLLSRFFFPRVFSTVFPTGPYRSQWPLPFSFLFLSPFGFSSHEPQRKDWLSSSYVRKLLSASTMALSLHFFFSYGVIVRLVFRLCVSSVLTISAGSYPSFWVRVFAPRSLDSTFSALTTSTCFLPPLSWKDKRTY